ncbi:DUF3299 domain-containing protein [Herbaspirillum sp. RV1423]|uniref:DUF3299 domain-containing protein n=1 Tax=Herbaspirillum sp. RV1423 TaxID=1443993 RepID=UPI0004AE7B38|nr:DUF3299 domain-containing protein [Herbaspirillum sp. RV1423]
MKSITWIGGIVAAGLLVGYSVHLAATPNAPKAARVVAASTTAAAPYSDNAQYKVGDHLQPGPDLASTPYKPSGKTEGGFREIAWESLIPKNWDAMAPFKGLKLDQMQDGDPRAMEALWKAKKYWKNAPIDPSMDGASIRIPGFVVSLEREGEALKEFLLVPYFGACIHVPPPPANQIIHVHSSKAVKNIRTMDAVWINGVLKVEHSDTMMGTAGYSMKSVKVEPYTDQATQGG